MVKDYRIYGQNIYSAVRVVKLLLIFFSGDKPAVE